MRIAPKLIAIVVLFVAPNQISATEPGNVELGFDGSIRYAMYEGVSSPYTRYVSADRMIIDFPSRVRIGFYLNESQFFEFTPALRAEFRKNSQSAVIGLGVGVGFQKQNEPGGVASYIKPELFVVGVFTGSPPEGAFGLGLELGIKRRAGQSLATRVALFAEHLFDNDDFVGSTQIGLSVGFSFVEL